MSIVGGISITFTYMLFVTLCLLGLAVKFPRVISPSNLFIDIDLEGVLNIIDSDSIGTSRLIVGNIEFSLALFKEITLSDRSKGNWVVMDLLVIEIGLQLGYFITVNESYLET